MKPGNVALTRSRTCKCSHLSVCGVHAHQETVCDSLHFLIMSGYSSMERLSWASTVDNFDRFLYLAHNYEFTIRKKRHFIAYQIHLAYTVYLTEICWGGCPTLQNTVPEDVPSWKDVTGEAKAGEKTKGWHSSNQIKCRSVDNQKRYHCWLSRDMRPSWGPGYQD